jgi:hypothetical protein
MKVKNGIKNKTWITIGIIASCKSKIELYLAGRNTNDLRLITKCIVKFYQILSSQMK